MRNNTRHASTGPRSRTRTPAGYFFLGVRLRYSKPALPIDQQLDLLIQRGLEVGERAEALHYLTHINYYRLRAYWLPFERPSKEGEHRFVAGTRFEDVLRLYIFDRELRLLLMDLIERVEVSMRTHWAHAQAMRHGPHAHLDPALYRDAETHSNCLQGLNDEISRSRETFIEHYRKTYTEPPTPHPRSPHQAVDRLGQTTGPSTSTTKAGKGSSEYPRAPTPTLTATSPTPAQRRPHRPSMRSAGMAATSSRTSGRASAPARTARLSYSVRSTPTSIRGATPWRSRSSTSLGTTR